MIRDSSPSSRPTTWFRAAVAVALVIGHLVAFTIAGHQRLGVPFNSAPGEAPYYSDPDAHALMQPPRQPHHWSRLIVSRWDAQHYIGFAARGLYACPKDGTGRQFVGCGLAWMPTLGLLARGVTDATGAPPDYVLLLFSLIAAIIINLLWTSRTIVSRTRPVRGVRARCSRSTCSHRRSTWSRPTTRRACSRACSAASFVSRTAAGSAPPR